MDVVVVVDGAVLVVVVDGAEVVVVVAIDVDVVGATVVDVLGEVVLGDVVVDVEEEDVGVLVVVLALAAAGGGSDGLPGASVTCASAMPALRGARKERTTAIETKRRAAALRIRPSPA